MMIGSKIKLTVLSLMLSIVSFAQLPTPQITIFNVHLEGLIVGAENSSIYLYNQNINQGKQPHQVITTNDKGEFAADFTIPFKDYYYFRLKSGAGLNLVLTGDDSIKIYGDTKDIINTSNIIGSEASHQMKDFYINYLPFKRFEDSLKNVLKQDPSKQAEVNTAFQTKAGVFYGYRNLFINQNTNSPALLAAIVAINKETEFELYKQVIERVIQVFPESPTSATLKRNLQQEISRKNAAAKLAPGKLAPDIAIPNKDGKIIKLSDLRGKVVLIDFWASWCGPCRRENPTVVSAYNKYNKDGFEVFSVSFDKPGMKDRWLDAIAKDGLVWPNHGSELKGFNNQAARDYAVKGIPFTCLVDREGKIIATKLRGQALLDQLKAIFGY